MFLAGAGLGFDSNLAVVEDVLRVTFTSLGLYSNAEEVLQSRRGTRFGPSEQFQFLLENVQPELAYSLLLQCSNWNQRCLDAWKSLRKSCWGDDYFPQPSPVHMFIAAYSFLAGVPILTMNFDTMFEDAFTLLWNGLCLKNPGHAPVTVLDYRQSPPRLSDTAKRLYICKLHGDIAGETQSISPDNIKTTLSSICQYMPNWANFVRDQAANEHLCLVGYSGRDTDFYPEIKRSAAHNPRTLWFVGPDGQQNKETLDNAQGLGSLLIDAWPADAVELCLDDGILGQAMARVLRDYSAGFNPPTSQAKAQFLKRLCASNTCNIVNPHLFWLCLYDSIGRNQEVSIRLKNFVADGFLLRSQLAPHEYDVLAETQMHNARELACFSQYHRIATDILNGQDRPPTHPLVLRARREQVSALQMAIPHHTGFPPPAWLWLVIRQCNRRVAQLFRELNSYFMQLPSETRQINIVTIQESLLREIALHMRFLPANPSPPQVEYFRNQLLMLQDEARQVGNYATFTGVERYLARLDLNTSRLHREQIELTAKITGEVSLRSIAQRDATNYEAAAAMARQNGNPLNELKTLLAKANAPDTANQAGNTHLEPEDLQRLLELAPLIESRLWRYTIQDILCRFFKVPRAELEQIWVTQHPK